jgi:P-type E1-E2 ATPase
VTAVIGGRRVVVGKPAYVAALAPDTTLTALEAGMRPRTSLSTGASRSPRARRRRTAESRAVVRWLRGHGVERVTMLTGDARPTADAVAASVGVDEVHADLLPAEKVHLAAMMTPRPVLMVGDGVNDAPVLAAADIGIAMGARGATAAGDAADAVVLKDSLTKVAEAVAIGRDTLRVAYVAIWIGIALSVAAMLLATTGLVRPSSARSDRK